MNDGYESWKLCEMVSFLRGFGLGLERDEGLKYGSMLDGLGYSRSVFCWLVLAMTCTQKLDSEEVWMWFPPCRSNGFGGWV